MNWSSFINWFSNDINNSSKGGWSYWNHNWVSCVSNLLSSYKSFGGIKSDCSYVITSEMLGDFEYESVADALYFKSIKNWWQVSFELNVNDCTNNL